jgi:hypothetical protein
MKRRDLAKNFHASVEDDVTETLFVGSVRQVNEG